MASEKSFAHLWLSEGFATYLTDIYMGSKYGKDSAAKRLQKERREVIEFMKTSSRPVVDSTTNLMSLLNANSYQKGGWILHMLHRQMGDSVFQKIIQTYYQQYKGSNADTRDFEHAAEQVSGKNLKSFFDQWLYQPGIPNVKVSWSYANGQLTITTEQTGSRSYDFNLPIAVTYNDRADKFNLQITKQKQEWSRSLGTAPVDVVLDPDTEILFEGIINKTK